MEQITLWSPRSIKTFLSSCPALVHVLHIHSFAHNVGCGGVHICGIEEKKKRGWVCMFVPIEDLNGDSVKSSRHIAAYCYGIV